MTFVLEMPDDEVMAIEAVAQARGLSAQQYARQVLKNEVTHAADTKATSPPVSPQPRHSAGTLMGWLGRSWSRPADEARDTRPMWEVIADNMKDVPAEDFAQLPRDGADQLDHYLYGHPKRNS